MDSPLSQDNDNYKDRQVVQILLSALMPSARTRYGQISSSQAPVAANAGNGGTTPPSLRVKEKVRGIYATCPTMTNNPGAAWPKNSY